MKSKLKDTLNSNEDEVRFRIFSGDLPENEAYQELLRRMTAQYDTLHIRYLELIQKTRMLYILLQKGHIMNEPTQDILEAAISKQMDEIAASHSPDGEKPIMDVETEAAVEVEHVYVQADDEIGGIEVPTA